MIAQNENYEILFEAKTENELVLLLFSSINSLGKRVARPLKIPQASKGIVSAANRHLLVCHLNAFLVG